MLTKRQVHTCAEKYIHGKLGLEKYKCSSIINSSKLQCIYTTEYHVTVRVIKLLLHKTTWKNIRNMILFEGRQMGSYAMVPYIWSIKSGHTELCCQESSYPWEAVGAVTGTSQVAFISGASTVLFPGFIEFTRMCSLCAKSWSCKVIICIYTIYQDVTSGPKI